MIVFLTLCYVGVLALLLKLGVIKLTLWWKLSPLVWMLLLFVVLFLPMQWGAPSGPVNVFQYVIEIVPNVTGEVIEVPIEPLAPLEPEDVLFRIDPIPYQAKVDELEAQLAAAIQNVDVLNAAVEAADATVRKTEDEIEIKQARIEAATATISVAEANLEQAETTLEKMRVLIEDLKVQDAAAMRELERRKQLVSSGAVSPTEVDQQQVNYSRILSQLNVALADYRAAEHNVAGSKATVDAEEAKARTAEVELRQLIDAELPRAKASAREAKLAAEAMINGEHVTVADARAKLAAAQFDLDQTTVRAPTKGHVAYLTLRPGQRVASFPMRSWMAFVDTEHPEIAVAIKQYALRHIQPGQSAELTFKQFPGQVFAATVDRIANINASAQVQPSGQLATSNMDEAADAVSVVLTMNDKGFDVRLAGGARGTAAIYTESMQATHIIRRVMIRMDAWMNYLIP
ncbi:MAG: efflux RND transporter periplasmic adaptor subunit [Planctomycetota bacterium]